MGFQSSVNSVIGTVAGLKVAKKVSEGAEAAVQAQEMNEARTQVEAGETAEKVAGLEKEVASGQEDVAKQEKELATAQKGIDPATNTAYNAFGNEPEAQPNDIKKRQLALQNAQANITAKQTQIAGYKRLLSVIGGKK